MKSGVKAIAWVAVGAVVAALAAGGVALWNGSTPAPVRIGILGEMTGRSADNGIAMRNGVLIAIDEYKTKGLLKGAEVEVLVRDAGDTRESAEQAARELAAARPLVVVGPVSTVTLEAAFPPLDAAGIVVMAPVAAALHLSGRDDHLFRGNWTTSENGSDYARHYFDAGIQTVSVVINLNNRAYADSWFTEFRSAYEALGGKVLAHEYFDSADSNLEGVLQKLLAPKPAALVLIANASDAGRLAQQTRKLNADVPLIASVWAGTTHLIQQGGKAVEGLRMVQNVIRDDTSVAYQSFIATYRERFNREPEYVSILSYDMAAAALQAHMRRTDGMGLKQALLTQGPFDGLQQKIRFNATGDNGRAAYFMVVRDGRFVRE